MKSRGFTLIELLVVICVVALVFGVALDRLLKYQELAERTALEQNLAQINVALTLKFAALVTSGRAAEVADEVGTNPVRLLERAPANYLGELYSPSVDSVPKGSWYYDLRSREFIYVPNRARFLTSLKAEPVGNLRFSIVLTEADGDEKGLKVLRQPYIAPVVPFRWETD